MNFHISISYGDLSPDLTEYIEGNILKTLKSVRKLINRSALHKKFGDDESDDEDKKGRSNPVEYYSNYCIDRSSIMRDDFLRGDDISPLYGPTDFQECLTFAFDTQPPTDTKEDLNKRRNKCFNCNESGHEIRNCPKDRSVETIRRNIEKFNAEKNNHSGNLFDRKYHEGFIPHPNDMSHMMKQKCQKMIPGEWSEDLLRALNVHQNQLPSFVYRMRCLGFPAGWLKFAENRTGKLTFNESTSGKRKREETPISFMEHLLFKFPGYNGPIPDGYIDEYRKYNVTQFDKEFSLEKLLPINKKDDGYDTMKRARIGDDDLKDELLKTKKTRLEKAATIVCNLSEKKPKEKNFINEILPFDKGIQPFDRTVSDATSVSNSRRIFDLMNEITNDKLQYLESTSKRDSPRNSSNETISQKSSEPIDMELEDGEVVDEIIVLENDDSFNSNNNNNSNSYNEFPIPMTNGDIDHRRQQFM